ncbi:unnamed protein product [Penicillium salamii]|uniref:Uncharacterized protein n=1 Tax=Penicillium salamii TaxID=1612424 RepID=A0A9W4JZ03_9EURO|nr:unnamed protein product [Penicillium salamii]CAG8061728.1 unnamed protein product [Penicillium salamii]CAG8254330.1 unnamed protein product [Penicillium salamii]CAG8282097.1 unnamed protein product [Penicillium salamii]CAG8287084.1 unnamed protein product [Penicillium salamii]
MSALNQINIPDLTGTWVFNRKLSDDPDEVFALQGVSGIIRKVLKYARLSLEICQTTGPVESPSTDETRNGDAVVSSKSMVTSLQVKQIVNPGGFDSQGCYIVDGRMQDLTVPVFGTVRTQLKFVDIREIGDDSIRQAFEIANYSEKVIQELAHDIPKPSARDQSKTWEAEVIWAFENIDGKRCLTRNVSIVGAEKKITVKMIYDNRV